jgi:D-glycero-D-manno-heptose 1,7-bisphosphate phosphatase
MLLAAEQELGVDLRHSYFVGDASSDVQAGQAVGCHSYLVLTGRGRDELRNCCTNGTGFRVATDLGMAADHILRKNMDIEKEPFLAVQGEEWRV